MQGLCKVFESASLRIRRLAALNGRKKERDAQGKHARGERSPAREAHENRFYSLSGSAEISDWSRGS